MTTHAEMLGRVAERWLDDGPRAGRLCLPVARESAFTQRTPHGALYVLLCRHVVDGVAYVHEARTGAVLALRDGQ